MLPRWHILLGALFTFIIWLFSPDISPLYLALVFFSSFLIDFDHYVWAAHHKKNLGLKCALDYYKKEFPKEFEKDRRKGIRKKYHFHLFHTLEFHIFVALLSLFWIGFFYILVGMIFHSLTDIVYMMYNDVLHVREFFFFNWVRNFFR